MWMLTGRRTADGEQPRGLRSGERVWRATPARLGAARCFRARAASNADSALRARILTPTLPSQILSTFRLRPSTPHSSSSSTTTTPQPSPAPLPPLSAPQSVPASSPTRRPPPSQGASVAATFTSAQVPPSASTPASPSDSLSARATMSTLPLARLSFHDFFCTSSYCQSYIPVKTSFTIFSLSPHIRGAITTPCTPM